MWSVSTHLSIQHTPDNMVAKFLTFFGLVSAAAAIALPVAPVSKVVYAEPEAPAQYEYTYSVQDSNSGDVKQQQESRSGDAVHGSYSLIQPDGVQRIVEYTADDHNGFNAVVRYEGAAVQSAPVAKIAYAPAPVTKFAYAQAPLNKIAYAPAPVSKIAYAPAPVTKIAYAPAPITNVAYAPAPITKVAYAAPVAKVAYAPAPITYAAPAPVAYAQAPISYATAPVTKLAYATGPVAKVAYSENLGRVSYSSPIVSYQH